MLKETGVLQGKLNVIMADQRAFQPSQEATRRLQERLRQEAELRQANRAASLSQLFG